MSTSPAVIESDTWPTIFTHPRSFDRATENKSCLAYLDEPQSESESDGNDWEDDAGNNSEEDGEKDDDDDGDDDDGQDDKTSAQSVHNLRLAQESPVVSTPSRAARLLAAHLRYQDKMHTHPEEEDVVADFLEHYYATRAKSEGLGLDSPLVALIRDESGRPVTPKSRLTRRQTRLHSRPLTRSELRVLLNQSVSLYHERAEPSTLMF